MPRGLKDYNEAPQANNIDRLSALRFPKRTVAMADAGISNKNPIACRAYFKIFIGLVYTAPGRRDEGGARRWSLGVRKRVVQVVSVFEAFV